MCSPRMTDDSVEGEKTSPLKILTLLVVCEVQFEGSDCLKRCAKRAMSSESPM